jgi:hypothetical protein
VRAPVKAGREPWRADRKWADRRSSPRTSRKRKEAIKRREQGETLGDIGRSYNVSAATISRLTPE